MALMNDVRLLVNFRGPPATPETVTAAENVMKFLDVTLFRHYMPENHPHYSAAALPRGYYYDVGYDGTEQLCMPEFVDSVEEQARIFAADVASGFLEELCSVLAPMPAAQARAELGVCTGPGSRAVKFESCWLTSAVLALEEAVYADRAFGRLPILADALEEAGCDHPDVLAHCRGGGPHARGCWVVDGILGKA